MECVSNKDLTIEDLNYDELNEWIKEIQNKANVELVGRFKIRRRKEYRDDAKKTFQRIVKPQGRFCEIEPTVLAENYAKNWGNEADIDPDLESIFITPVDQNNCLISDEVARKKLINPTTLEEIIK
jgi:hypothetical protein